MSTPVVTPNMSLTEPVIGGTLSPGWAMILNANFSTLDQHDHTPGNGVQITPAGISISSDLTFLDNNATNLRTTRFTPLSLGSLTGADTDCLLVSGVDLYYVDGSGNQVRITSGGGVAGSNGSIANLASPASASYVSASSTFVWQSNSGVAANMDAATYILRYPSTGYPSPAGNYIAIQAPSSLASGYALTLPTSVPSANSFVQMSTGGALSATIPLSQGITAANIANGTITGTQIASNTIAASQLQYPNVALGSNAGTVSTSSTSFTTISSATITTEGRPVSLVCASGGTTVGYFQVGATFPVNSGFAGMMVRLVKDGTTVISEQFLSAWLPAAGSQIVNTFACGAINIIDWNNTSGSHTYTVDIASNGPYSGTAVNAFSINVVLRATEL